VKKKILIIGENMVIEEYLLLNNYIICKEKNEKLIDIIVVFDKNRLNENILNIKEIPVILLGNIENQEQFRENFDFISDKHSNIEVIKKIEATIAIKELEKEKKRLQTVERELIYKLQILNEINKKLFLKSKDMEAREDMDSIANVYNKKYMLKRIAEEKSKVERYDRNFAIAVIKIIPDIEIGEYIRDEKLLKKSAIVLNENIRSSDVAGIMRENVFIVMFPEIIEKYTISVMQKIISNLENIKVNEKNISIISGFFVIDKNSSKKYPKVENIVSIMEKLLYFARESNKKIVEYCEDKIETIEKVKKYIEEVEYDKHSLIIDELSKSQKFIEKLLPKAEKWKEILKYSYLYTPFNFIGGDYFDFVEIDNEKTAVIFCDVSGHGVSSALYITAIKYIFKNLVQKEYLIEPHIFLEKFNQNIVEISEGNIFVATVYGIIDKKNRTFTYGFGGGTTPIRINEKNKSIKELEGSGIAVGLINEASFETKEEQFEEGEILFFYSDGIYEFLIEKNIIKEQSEFMEVVKSCIDSDEEKFISKIYGVMQEKTEDGVDFDDDITLLAVKF
jgi:phosphoserine phosphatase RsbU/P